MPDPVYREFPFLFQSKGIQARAVDDLVPPEFYLNLDNCEETAEGGFGQRLGSVLVNATGSTGFRLGGGAVTTLSKLAGLNGSAWRYAGTAGGNLFRRTGLTAGAYTLISNTVSGNPMWAVAYRPDVSSISYLFFADSNGMFKDNGSFSSPQGMGIFQPRYPVFAQSQNPSLIILDNYTTSHTTYTYTGISGGTNASYVNTTLTSSTFVSGLNTVTVADPTQIGLFQLLTIGGTETVLVLAVTPTGFTAVMGVHASGSTVTSASLSVTVPASTTATVSKSFSGTPISAWPTTLQQADYIGIYLYVSDPAQVQSITIKFDCGDGSFNTDYFYKVVAQGPLQSLLETVNTPTTAATDALLSQSLGLYDNTEGGIGQLYTGLDVWTPLLFQLSDFAGSGRADFSDPVFNWSAVNGYQIQIVTNDQTSATVQFAALILEGGSGPDTLGGVAYDYVFTFYNINDGTESNPSQLMTNVNPPNNTTWVYPRRQPVLIHMIWGTATVPFTRDPQTTHLRIYRRGGTLGDNFRRIDQVPITGGNFGQSYTDVVSDAALAASDIVSLTNDVPVTSTLPVPVNTTLTAPLTPTVEFNAGLIQVVSTANMSVGQQVTIGNPTDPSNNFETVIVVLVFSATVFYAFVQNNHASGESVQATAAYGQPVTIMALAYNQMYFAGDPNNPHYLYFSAVSNPQAVGSANYVEVGSPDDPITAIVAFAGNLYVSTVKFWYSLAPGSNGKPTPYPTRVKHGCVAPFGWVLTEEGIYYQAIDGLRFFGGGASTYLTQDLEFIFQGIGTTPIVEADQTQLSKTVAAYWNNMVFFSYVGLDGNRHRVILHTQYKRWRNDDFDTNSILLEADTNTLVVGDSNGGVHLDRQNVPTDQSIFGSTVIANGIPINLQSPYNNQGMPDIQKNYVELTLDVNTNGQTLTATLLFDDGEATQVIGTFSNSQRGKINFNMNSGKGFTYYKVSLKITGETSNANLFIYQCSIKAVPIAKTRLTFDTYKLNLGTDESKMAKNAFFDLNSTQPVNVTVFYDDSILVPPFTFTLPSTGGIRDVIRQRLPAVSFRLIRLVGVSTADFQLWNGSKIEMKNQCSGKGWSSIELVPN